MRPLPRLRAVAWGGMIWGQEARASAPTRESTMTTPTFAQAAANLSLWREWFDSDQAVSDEEFHSMTAEQRISLLEEVWGDD